MQMNSSISAIAETTDTVAENSANRSSGNGMSLPNIRCTLATALSDLQAAIRLVHQEFAKENYIDPNTPSWMEIPEHNLLSTSATFIARYNNKVVGTLSVILDSSIGLPMDDLYQVEVDVLRTQQKTVAQVTQFAIDRDFVSQGETKKMLLFVHLFKLAIHYCTFMKVDELCTMINPKHSAFYNSFFSFEELGGLKLSPSVNHAPAIAKCLNVPRSRRNDRERNSLCREIFGNPPDYAIFERRSSLDGDTSAGTEKEEMQTIAQAITRIDNEMTTLESESHESNKDNRILIGNLLSQRATLEEIKHEYRSLEAWTKQRSNRAQRSKNNLSPFADVVSSVLETSCRLAPDRVELFSLPLA